MLGNPTLGCDNDYVVGVTSSCSNTPERIANASHIFNLRYGALLDNISEAVAEIASDECEEFLGGVSVGSRYLIIIRNGITVFHGPIVRVELTRNSVRIVARDPLWWATRRIYEPNDLRTIYKTPVHMFEEAILKAIDDPTVLPDNERQCDQEFPPLCFEDIYRLPGGEPIKPPDNHDARIITVLDDLADTVLDYTVVGRTLLYGFKEVPIPANHIVISVGTVVSKACC